MMRTYKELVNGVLTRLREDAVATVAAGDAYVQIVADYVNDAKRTVEDAWRWNGLRRVVEFTTVEGQQDYSLTDSGNYAIIDTVLNTTTTGYLGNQTLKAMRYRDAVYDGTSSYPTTYALNGIDGNGDVKLRLSPVPIAGQAIQVDLWQRTPDFTSDDDVLVIPDKPVLYHALALAASERGEVGGLTSAELSQVARRYLSDAIALDANMNPADLIWYTE